MGEWRKAGVQWGRIYRLAEHDLERVGNCWLKGRLRAGDLVTIAWHSGDCFYTYQLIEGGNTRPNETVTDGKGQLSYHICVGGTFGAYVLGTPYQEQPTPTEYEALMQGHSTRFSDRLDPERAAREESRSVEAEHERVIERAVESLKADLEADPVE